MLSEPTPQSDTDAPAWANCVLYAVAGLHPGALAYLDPGRATAADLLCSLRRRAFFFGAFVYVCFLRSRGLLHGLAAGTNWVFRDESAHMAFDFCADQRLVTLGLPKHYQSRNPFFLMDLQDVQEVANFFERRVTSNE